MQDNVEVVPKAVPGAAPDPAVELAVGSEIGEFVRTTGPENWNRFAAVNDEFVDIHMDDDAGRGAGYAAAIGMGNLQWAYLHNVLRAWAEPYGGEILSLSCQFRAPNLKGQVVTAAGRAAAITPAPGGGQLVTLDVWTKAGEQVLAPGTATVLVHALE